MPVREMVLEGERFVIESVDDVFPEALASIPQPPERLYGVGNVGALKEGLAVVGARRATPYGRGCAKRFATLAAERGVTIISGGARGCDAVAHEAALAVGAPTVAFLGGGCNQVYPAENAGLFQRIVNAGGAVVSEHDWDFPPKPYTFRARNRLIAGLARAILIAEAGLPSGTFSTADEALLAGREVWVVPGAITSAASRGANRLLYQGAVPIVDDDAFADALFSAFGCLKTEEVAPDSADGETDEPCRGEEAMLAALRAEPLGMEALRQLAEVHGPQRDAFTWLMVWLAQAQRDGLIAQYPDGRYGPCPTLRMAV
ncbi:DNA-processing protein DprA [Adlercreutzia sp. R25]|uniref:DNA-processing protein DprA n=1 Tax=Adlercreutzia shanghongiae TaxID=3111773 RepID=A0ABU6IY15_9ACTN|nr:MULTISPECIES: DNA-processing protein DprA [unclassified Adlercreutzia]MEC4272597.1 DNA-processing protein DprA [Adlercreutzia sp. R25]MEC4294502.1 DNA-processing protein DprA [Adlercreutzia sp. R22]